jgi:hypothetical protein
VPQLYVRQKLDILMNPLILIMIAMVSPIQFGFADGLPVDPKTSKIFVPHSTVDITDAQKDEIDILGSITFTAAQLQGLRKAFPECPKRINHVFPVSFQDNVGDPSPYVIRTGVNMIAVVPDSSPPIRDWLMRERGLLGRGLSVDRRGQFYLSGNPGVLIPFKNLLSMIKETKDLVNVKDDDREIVVSLPYGMQRDDSVVKGRIDLISAESEKANVKIRIFLSLPNNVKQ